MERWKGLVPLVAVFFVWMMTSFVCHKLAKTAMSIHIKGPTTSHVIVLPMIVTLSQMVCCLGTVQISWKLPLSPLILLSHVLATLATNTSMALTFASSTMAIKMLEPVSSAVLQTTMLKMSMGCQTVVSLILVVGGAVLYVGSPWQDGAVATAVILAFLSNIVLGLRNVAVKLSQQDNHQNYHLKNLSSVIKFACLLSLCLLLSYGLETSAKVFPPNSTFFLSLTLASGVFHVAYSYVSMKVVLNYMSVVSHAVANILKRVLVVLLLHVTGRRSASVWNWAGLVVCAAGLGLYHRYKPSSAPSRETDQSTQGRATTTRQLTARSFRGMILLTITYVICVTSVGVNVAIPGGPFSSWAWDKLSVPAVLRAASPRDTVWNESHAPPSFNSHKLWEAIFEQTGRQTPAADMDSQNYITSIIDALEIHGNHSKSPLIQKLHNTTMSLQTLPFMFNTTAMELSSEIRKINRQVSQEVSSTNDYARRVYLGLEKWRDGQLLMNRVVEFQPARKSLQELREFVRKKPITDPFGTDGLSPYLTTTRAVIAEAERIHLNLFHALLAGKKYAILFGLASFENKGDPAITVGEVVLLEKLGIKLIFYVDVGDCGDKRASQSLAVAHLYPAHEVAILMSGGGNLIGYPTENDCRRRALKLFPSYQSVLFSESIYMRGTQANMDSLVSMYCCSPNLSIVLRDRQSLHIAQRIFNGGTRLFLAPDMAFHNGPVTRFVPPYYDIMWLDRHDGEKPESMSFNISSSIKVSKGDWMSMPSMKGNTAFQKAVNILLHGYQILQRGRVVITERLHGHILCVLLDIPHVLLDNNDLKLSSYHNTWTRGISNCRLTNSVPHAIQLAMELLQNYNHSLPSLLPAAHIKV